MYFIRRVLILMGIAARTGIEFSFTEVASPDTADETIITILPSFEML